MIKDMTKGNPTKMILLFSMPILIGSIFQQFYSMVDSIIVGRYLGVEALAAVGNTSALNFVILGFISGITSGFGINIARKFGKKDEEGLKKSVASSIVLSILFSVVITIISVLAVRPALELINTPENIIAQSELYIKIIFLGTVAVVFYNVASSILRAIGDSKTPLYFLILASILNIVLDIVFIRSFHMGVEGAAYATIISQGVSAIFCIIYAYKKYKILRVKKEDFKFEKRTYEKHLTVGLPMGLQFSITGLGIIIVQGGLNVFGSDAIAAYSTGSKALSLAIQISNSIGITIANFCGQNMGAKNYERIRIGVKSARNITIIMGAVLGAILVFGSKYFVNLFIENPSREILDYTQECLNYAGIFFVILGLLILYRNALQGIGDSFVPMMAGFYELVARTIIVFTLPKFIGYTGICVADPIAWIVATIPLMYSYNKRIKSLNISDERQLKADKRQLEASF